jgi:hypothetical protein
MRLGSGLTAESSNETLELFPDFTPLFTLGQSCQDSRQVTNFPAPFAANQSIAALHILDADIALALAVHPNVSVQQCAARTTPFGGRHTMNKLAFEFAPVVAHTRQQERRGRLRVGVNLPKRERRCVKPL